MSNPNTYTIADVAKAAGVSVSTVSRILNGKQDVASETRERVQLIIKELGFAPHTQAKQLRAGKTRNLALLFPLKYPGNLPYNALEVEFILGAAAAAAEKEFLFSLLTTPVTKHSLLNLYRSAQVDGLVLMHIHTHDWRVELLRHHNYPFVMIGHEADNTGLNFVDLDFENSVKTAFDYMVSLGHRRIGFLTLPGEMRQNGYGPAARAWAGYEQALDTHQLDPLYREVNFFSQDIFDATLQLLDERPNLTAIITTHELASLSVIQALTKRGRNIPEDCSLIAVMTEQMGNLSTPPMTHIDFPSHYMGYKAVDMLIRSLKGELVEPEQILLPPRLVIRDSVAALR
ncbi:MAG: LacI family DNA-binding transcriptional regulator [Chloroflexota bacterium]